MKIGIDARAAKWYRGTGIGTYVYQLIHNLNRMDSANDYLLFMPQYYDSGRSFSSNFQIRNITENVRDNFWDEINIPNILQDQDISLYHVPQNGVGLPEDKHCPFVITLHDVIPYKMPQTVGDRYLKIFTEQIPDIVSRCDGIITVSNYSKKDIMDAFHFPEDKIFVTYLAAEEQYRPLDKEYSRNFIAKEYSLYGDFILYIGGFSPRKNIMGLIEAFSKLPRSLRAGTKLVIAGKQGISYPLYKRKAEELHVEEQVLFPGFIPLEHLPELYNAAKLFAYPSFYEGFGLPPVEAMACGTPVITSNVTSIPEILGDSALQVDPHDIEKLSNAIERLLQDEALRNTLILKGLHKSKALSWDQTSKNTLRAYRQIVDSLR